jgi:hypothetical protein
MQKNMAMRNISLSDVLAWVQTKHILDGMTVPILKKACADGMIQSYMPSDPTGTQPAVLPNKVLPNKVLPNKVEPNKVEPNKVEPNKVEPKPEQPKPEQSKTTFPPPSLLTPPQRQPPQKPQPDPNGTGPRRSLLRFREPHAVPLGSIFVWVIEGFILSSIPMVLAMVSSSFAATQTSAIPTAPKPINIADTSVSITLMVGFLLSMVGHLVVANALNRSTLAVAQWAGGKPCV